MVKVAAFDPGSIVTGYSIMTAPDQIIEAGYLKGVRADDEPIDRIVIMCKELKRLIAEHKPTDIVVEITSGKVGARHKGGGAGLGVHGMATGAIFMEAFHSQCPEQYAVTENEWTRGVPKRKRQRLIAMQFPEYKAMLAKDTGGDVSDAIGLGQWWFAHRME